MKVLVTTAFVGFTLLSPLGFAGSQSAGGSAGGGSTTPGAGSPTGGSSTDPGSTDGGDPGSSDGGASTSSSSGSRHEKNKAIAFASIILNANGGNMDQWKAVQAFGCSVDGGTASGGPAPGSGGVVPPHAKALDSSSPVPPAPTPVTPAPGPGGSSGCDWTVLYTTDYQLEECPDGTAYIARSGQGVALQDRHNGTVFGWAEAVACQDNPPVLSGTTTSTGMQANRPLNPAKIVRSPL